MYELVQAGACSYYIDCPAKIGVYLTGESEVYLIDSGNDKSAGKRALRILEERGWRLKGIVNTHSHADHIGGNQFLQQKTGCKVFAMGAEAAFTRFPFLEPSFLYGGCPFGALRHKFLLAAESRVTDIAGPDFPDGLEIIPLPGHSFDMIGLRTPDGTVFLADCLSSEATLQKYPVAFVYDVAAYLDTLVKVEAFEAPLFVPSHAPATRDIAPLARLNREKAGEIAAALVEMCAAPMGFEGLLGRVFDRFGLAMNAEQYVLVGSTLRSYLAYLADAGRLAARFENNQLLWERV